MAIERTDYFAGIQADADAAAYFLKDIWADPATARLVTTGDHLEIARFQEADIEDAHLLDRQWVDVDPFRVIVQGLHSTSVLASITNNKKVLEISDARFSISGLSIIDPSSSPELQNLSRRITARPNTPYITLDNTVTLSGQEQFGGRLLIDRIRQDRPVKQHASRQRRSNP